MKTKLYLFTTLMFLTLVIWAQDEPKFHEMFIQEWIDNNWEDTLKTTNTYDTSGNLIKSTSEVRNQETDAWENAIVMDYTLNTDATVKEVTMQIWEEGEWMNAIKTIYTYNGSKKVLSETHQMWLGIVWMDMAKTDYTYENDLLMKQLTKISTLVSPELVNSEQITYTYNSDGTEKDYIVQSWNVDQWKNTTRVTNTYDASKQLTMTASDKWENEAWVTDSRTINTYNEGGSLIQSTEETYTADTWVYTSQTLHSYNTAGVVDNVVYQVRNVNLSEWENQFRFVYNYTPTGLNPVELAGLIAFPNPFEDHLTIQSGLQEAYGIEIINSAGQVIQSIQTQENILNLDLKALKRGMYFIKVKMGQNERSIKVLKAR